MCFRFFFLLFPILYFLIGNSSHNTLIKDLVGTYFLFGNNETILTLLDDSTFSLTQETLSPSTEKGKWHLSLHDFDQVDLNFENKKDESFEVIRQGDSVILSDEIATHQENKRFIKKTD